MRLNRLSLILLGATALPAPVLAQELPTGAVVVNGDVTISTPGPGSMNIIQDSAAAIVNWNSFSIGATGIVNVDQPGVNAVILNRVTGDTPSTIAGQLTSTGQIFIVNPNGIAITSTGVVETSGFAASTLDISDQDFLSGDYTFTGDGSSATVSNAGRITVTPGSYAALIGGRVDNSGTIVAPLGKIGFGAAELVTMDISGDGFLQVAIPSDLSGDDPLISNSGLASADGGYIQMTAAAANDVARSVINLSGTAEARNVSGRSGAIVLSGDGGLVTITGTIDTSTVQQSAPIVVPVPAPRPSYRGGDITITGGAIRLADASLNASGDEGGGDIRIGGDWGGNGLVPTATTLDVDFLTSIVADALIDGDGGTVVLWSDETTRFAGSISAKGAGEVGVGGSVEVSGKGLLQYAGLVDLRSESGAFGTLLLDPYNIGIYETDPDSVDPDDNDGPPDFTPTGDDSVIIANELENQLELANVTISTEGDGLGTQPGNIDVLAEISWLANTLLTLDADGSIVINGDINAGGGINLVAGGNVDIACDCNGLPMPEEAIQIVTGGLGVTINAGAGFMNQGGGISYVASDSFGEFTGITSGGDITVTADTGANFFFENTTATGDIDVNAATIQLGGNIGAGGALNLDATDFIIPFTSSPYTLSAGADGFTATAADVDLGNFDVTTPGTVLIEGDAQVDVGNVSGTGGVTIRSSLGTVNIGGQIASAATTNIEGSQGITTTTGSTIGGSDISLSADGGDIDLNGTISGGSIGVTASGDVDIGGALTASIGELTVDADGSVVVNAAVSGNTGVSIDAGDGGSAGNIDVNAEVESESGDVSLTATGTVTIADDVTASGTATITAGQDVVFSALSAGGPGTLEVGSVVADDVLINTAGSVTLNSFTDGSLSQPNFIRTTAGDIVIVTSQFVNLAGDTALRPYVPDGPGTPGRFLVYSTNWADDTRGGLVGANLYNRTFGANPPGSIPGGNAFIYADQPTLTITVGDLIRMYFGTIPGQPTIGIAGLVNGDTFAHATDGNTTATDTTATDADVGTYAGALQLLGLSASDAGYHLEIDSGDISVTAAPLTLTGDDLVKIYGNLLTFDGTEFTAAGLMPGDVLGTVTLDSDGAPMTAVVAGSPYVINISNAVGGDFGNYTITFVPGALSVNQRTLTITADDLTKLYGLLLNLAGTEFTVDGLVNGDTVDFVQLISAGQQAAALPGVYEIATSDASGRGLDNYAITYVPGTLEVTAPVAPGPGGSVIGQQLNNGIADPPGSDPLPDALISLVTQPDSITEVVGLDVTPGEAQISLQTVEQVSARFGEEIAECERQLDSTGDSGAYLTCAGNALDAYADDLENPLIKLPPELQATVTVIRQTAERVRVAAASPNRQQAVREARAAVGELVDFVKEQTALVRAVDAETQDLLQQQGEVMTAALNELDLQLVGAVEI